MSNRLTFSLVSLVLIFALTFSAAFVDEAQANADFEGKTISDKVFTEDIDVGTITLPTAKNADSYRLTDLPSGLSFDATARTITGDAEEPSGRSVYTYTAVDDDANDATLTFTIEVKANKAPKFATDAEIKDLVLKIGIDAEPLVDFPTATDPDAGDELTYSLDGTLPNGVQFDPFQQRFVGRPTTENTSSVGYTYTATDRDSNTATLTFNITAVEANAKPTFGTGATRESIANMTLKVDEAIKDTFLPPATDANTGDELTYTLPGTLPTGLEYIESARLLRGTPTAVKAETEYTYTVTDPDGNTDELKFKITVRADPVFAESASIRDYTFVVGTEVDAGPFPTATDADDDIDAYSISPQPPDGVTFVASLRKLLGNPTATQEATEYTYTVTDEAGGTDELTFNITVADQAPADTTPPVLTSTVGTPDATTGAVTVTLGFDEALKAAPTVTSSGTPTGHDTTYTVSAVTGGTAADPNTYMVTVTPKMGTDLTADVPALTVTLTVSAMDTSDNELTTGNTVDVTLAARTAPADTTPPVLTSTVGTPDATTGAVTVTLGFDEALKAAPTVTSSGTPTGHDTTYTVSAVTGGTAANPNTYMVTVTPKMGTDLTADVPALTVTLTVSAMDTSDNELTTGNTVDVTLAARKVVQPNRAPTVTATAPTDEADETATVTFTLNDADSGDTLGVGAAIDAASVTAGYSVGTPTVSNRTGSVTITGPDHSSTTGRTIPARTVILTLTPSDGTTNGTPVNVNVAFGARVNAAPTLTITTSPPDRTPDPSSGDILAVNDDFPVAFTTADADDDAVTVAAVISVDPATATSAYSISSATPTMATGVTIMQAISKVAGQATPGGTVTLTLTPSDALGAGTPATIEVLYDARPFDAADWDETPPIVVIGDVADDQGSDFEVRFSVTDKGNPSGVTDPAGLDTDIHGNIDGIEVDILGPANAATYYKLTEARPYRVTNSIGDITFASFSMMIKPTRKENRVGIRIVVTVPDRADNVGEHEISVTLGPKDFVPVVTSNPNIISCLDGSIITVTFDRKLAVGEKLTADEIKLSNPDIATYPENVDQVGWEVVAGSITAPSFNEATSETTVQFKVMPKADRSWLGQTRLRVHIAPDVNVGLDDPAVKDLGANTNAKNEHNTVRVDGVVQKDPDDPRFPQRKGTFTIGPVLEIDPGGYIAVARDKPNPFGTGSTLALSHLGDTTLTVADKNVRALRADVQGWECMPDLGVLLGIAPYADKDKDRAASTRLAVTGWRWYYREGIARER